MCFAVDSTDHGKERWSLGDEFTSRRSIGTLRKRCLPRREPLSILCADSIPLDAITKTRGSKNDIFSVESYRPHSNLDIAAFENDNGDFAACGNLTIIFGDGNECVGIREGCLLILRTERSDGGSVFAQDASHIRAHTWI